jgi:hypothetical protein
MSFIESTNLETIDYVQPNWNAIMNSNSQKLEEIFTSFALLWDAVSRTDGFGIKWDGDNWVMEQAIELYTIKQLSEGSSTIIVDASNCVGFTITLTGNRTLQNPSNMLDGKTYYWLITQDGVGGRTISFDTAYKFSYTPALSTDPGAVDLIKGSVFGADIYCELHKGFIVGVDAPENIVPPTITIG